MSEQRAIQKRISLYILGFVVLCEIFVTLSYERGVLAVQHYAGPVCFAFIGMMLLSGRTKLNIDERIALLYPVWYLSSRLLLRELYLDESFYPFCSMNLVYGLAFPFAHWTDDGVRKAGLRIVAVLFGAVYGVLSWIGVYAAVSESVVALPYLGTTLSMDAKRLCMSTHPNVTACIFFAAFVMLMWLMLSDSRRWVKILCVIGLLGLYLAIGLTDSRTVMIQLACAIAVLAMFACQKLPIRPKILHVTIPILVAVVVLFVTFLSFDAAVVGLTEMSLLRSASAESLSANRSTISDLKTMTGRTPIYEWVFDLIGDHPDVLWRGLRESEFVSLQNQYGIPVNTHNAWLQTLILTGIPGLLIALWFTVRTVMLAFAAAFKCGDRVRIADKFLLSAPFLLLINGITESYVFTELKPYYNFAFFLLLGYAMEIWRRMRIEKVNE